MNATPTLPRRPAGAHAAAPAAAAPATSPAAAPAALAPIDRAVLALGTALVAWSHRAERRGAAHPVAPVSTPDHLSVSSARAAPRSHADSLRETHHLRRTAIANRSVILAQRDLGANRLLR
ncbi:hypothetical protein B7R22_01260 [Subtercola boreus]|uniref:Uncharacterized protein n=1 Tax=Subtercola boreus TaxID=120213 RepID=A0A3E0W5Z8_9MICO|nr:hypothetical protein [Subtercola boreus]RFA16963.1 hypothetical protein B7R22_01260 [Subtercola boreus]